MAQPNTLSDHLTEKERQEVVSLKITGFMGRYDFYDVINKMSDVWTDDEDGDLFMSDDIPDPAIRHLDMGDATYVDGDDLPYCSYHTQLETCILPKGLKTTIDEDQEYETGLAESKKLRTLVLPAGLKTVGDLLLVIAHVIWILV